MSHYECSYCGVYMCGGECRTAKTPERLEREAAEERRQIARSHRFILDEEAARLRRIAEAEEFFRTHDENGNPLPMSKIA